MNEPAPSRRGDRGELEGHDRRFNRGGPGGPSRGSCCLRRRCGERRHGTALTDDHWPLARELANNVTAVASLARAR
jgi:hypothetical protein